MKVFTLLGLFALAFAPLRSAYADDNSTVYKLVVQGHAVYGTPVDKKHFKTCSNVVIDTPAHSKLVQLSGSCPSSDDQFLPYSGHGKLPTAKPSARPSPEPTR